MARFITEKVFIEYLEELKTGDPNRDIFPVNGEAMPFDRVISEVRNGTATGAKLVNRFRNDSRHKPTGR